MGQDSSQKKTYTKKELYQAVKSGKAAIVKEILKSGMDVNTVLDRKKNTALSLALVKSKWDVAGICLDYGADVNIKTKRFFLKTPLFIALERLQSNVTISGKSILSRLVDSGADFAPEGEMYRHIFQVLGSNSIDPLRILLDRFKTVKELDDIRVNHETDQTPVSYFVEQESDGLIHHYNAYRTTLLLKESQENGIEVTVPEASDPKGDVKSVVEESQYRVPATGALAEFSGVHYTAVDPQTIEAQSVLQDGYRMKEIYNFRAQRVVTLYTQCQTVASFDEVADEQLEYLSQKLIELGGKPGEAWKAKNDDSPSETDKPHPLNVKRVKALR